MRYFICLDGSAESTKAFACAMELRKEKDEFIVCTVVKTDKDRENGEKLLQPFVTRCKESGIPCQVLVLEAKDPREPLCESAEKSKADLLVVGTRGLGAIKRFYSLQDKDSDLF